MFKLAQKELIDTYEKNKEQYIKRKINETKIAHIQK